MLKRLFTKDFSIFVISSLICSIADVAMSFVMSVIVYKETGSTFLSGIFYAMSFLPNILIPLFFSPWVDNNYKKPLLVGCNLLIGICHIAGFFVFSRIGFNYICFMIFDLVCGCIGGIYQIAYSAYFPCLIEDDDLLQKGYTIFSMTYPICSIVFTPLATLVYQKIGVAPLLFCTGSLMIITGIFDCFLKNKGVKKEVTNYKNYFEVFVGEIKYAINYLKNEKGLNRWYYYCSISNSLGSIRTLMTTAFFTANPALGLTAYSFLSVAEFSGRTIGSIFNMRYKYLDKHKAKLTMCVYLIYDTIDTILLFIPYFGMLASKSIAGFLGVNTFVLRESAVMQYIPDEDRGKINSLFNIRTNILNFFVSIFGGYLGDIFGFKKMMVICGMIGYIAIFYCVFLNLDGINHVFTYKKKRKVKVND